jgi:hypothetical protein
MSENKTVIEMHGCIVCARIFNVLAIYAPDGRLVDYTVNSPGGHIVPNERRPLVACDTHTPGEIETAYNRWIAGEDEGVDNESDDERDG